ncbi:MAG: pyridoxal-phosphate dependent enzyme, partial [Actinomycetota bacterium]|nr:pyridoxal-phosphate dependent enzyme [Actinomycetota bacterium]
MLTLADIEAARARIGARVRRTPLVEVEPAAFASAPARLWLKLEQTQHTGSFKVRGAFNRLLATRERGELPPSGVVAASGGNAGLAVAHAARELGVPAEVFVPAAAPTIK